MPRQPTRPLIWKAAMPALTPTPLGLALARDDARALCCLHHIALDRGDDFVLVVSELVGNAVLHGLPPNAYEVSFDAGDLLIAVDDTRPEGPPAPGPLLSDTESGRGLAIVQNLASRWGWFPIPSGKRVWARV